MLQRAAKLDASRRLRLSPNMPLPTVAGADSLPHIAWSNLRLPSAEPEWLSLKALHLNLGAPRDCGKEGLSYLNNTR